MRRSTTTDAPAKERKAPRPRCSFNEAVTIVKYNKYNANLASPPPEERKSSGSLGNLKVAKKTFARRSTTTDKTEAKPAQS